MDYPIKTLRQLRPILVGFRKQAGLTQDALAQRLGISQQSYAAFEANPQASSVERLFRVLRQLDVAINLGASERAAAAPSPARVQTRAGEKGSTRKKPAAGDSPRAPRPATKKRENW